MFLLLAQTVTSNADWRALMALYNATDGAGWANNTNWGGSEQPPCPATGGNWFGVTCDGNQVSSLFLNAEWATASVGLRYALAGEDTQVYRMSDIVGPSNNKLHGTLPTELFLLNLTDTLLISYSSLLSGTVPTQIGQLSRMRGDLTLVGSSISGTLPSEIGLLTNIR